MMKSLLMFQGLEAVGPSLSLAGFNSSGPYSMSIPTFQQKSLLLLQWCGERAGVVNPLRCGATM